jgi:hypothetical protein
MRLPNYFEVIFFIFKAGKPVRQPGAPDDLK